MAKINIDLGDIPAEDANAARLRSLAAPLPSVSRAKSTALSDELKRAPRVQLAFSQVPKPIKDRFAAVAQERGITMKELFYECLRAGGIDIPATSEIDRRRL